MKSHPYLIVEFTEHPAEGVNTSVKGWMSDPKNIQIREKVYMVDRLNNINQAGIIIDLLNGSVVKKSVDKKDDELVSHYITRYEKMIHQGLVSWTRKEATRALQAEFKEAKK